MKLLLVGLALTFISISHAQQRLILTLNGQPVGEANLSLKIDSMGGVTQTIKSTMKGPGGSVTLNFETVADKNGRPIRKTSLTGPSGSLQAQTVIYGAKSIRLQNRVGNGKATTKEYPIPKGNISDGTMLWFTKIRPKKGATVTYLDFSSQTGKWKSKTSTYVGDETVPGTKMKGHHIHQLDGEIWVDDKGIPIRMEHVESGVEMVLARPGR
jgi:hypothetical protein